MNYSKKENKDFALKLILMYSQKILELAQDIRADRLENKELLEIIKKLEMK